MGGNAGEAEAHDGTPGNVLVAHSDVSEQGSVEARPAKSGAHVPPAAAAAIPSHCTEAGNAEQDKSVHVHDSDTALECGCGVVAEQMSKGITVDKIPPEDVRNDATGEAENAADIAGAVTATTQDTNGNTSLLNSKEQDPTAALDSVEPESASVPNTTEVSEAMSAKPKVGMAAHNTAVCNTAEEQAAESRDLNSRQSADVAASGSVGAAASKTDTSKSAHRHSKHPVQTDAKDKQRAAGMRTPLSGSRPKVRGLEGHTFKTATGRKLSADEFYASLERVSKPPGYELLEWNEDGTVRMPPQAHARSESRRLPATRIQAMSERLCPPPVERPSRPPPRPAVWLIRQLVDNKWQDGERQWKRCSRAEQKSAMCAMFDKHKSCLAAKEEQLAAKYLQPLCKVPRSTISTEADIQRFHYRLLRHELSPKLQPLAKQIVYGGEE